jgi:hypothetical protein
MFLRLKLQGLKLLMIQSGLSLGLPVLLEASDRANLSLLAFILILLEPYKI